MLEVMQNLALCHLWKELEGNKIPPNDLRRWFTDEKKANPSRFFSFLVEPAGKVEKYYTLSADPENADVAILESADVSGLNGQSALKLPFNRPSGPQSAQLGPVIKRSYTNKKAGPTNKILTSTLLLFTSVSQTQDCWSNYFKEVVNCFKRKQISIDGEIHNCKKNALEEAINKIDESKVIFLTYKDSQNRLPGDVPEYCTYLQGMIEADNKYTTGKALPIDLKQCHCCDTKNVKTYPAGLSKAGINIFNIDRKGAFPNLTNENAYLSYAICENCADLLYAFKFHISENYLSHIAGEQSLILPELYLEPKYLNKFLSNFKNYLEKLQATPDKALIVEKKQLLRLLIKENAICSLDIYWGDLRGQVIKDLSGNISDVLPSRLRQISEQGKAFELIDNPFFPKHKMENFEFDLNLSFIRELLHRPGGKKAKGINASRKQTELKRLLAEAIYKGKRIPEKRFWEEVMITAEWYFKALSEKDNPQIDCLYEGFSEKKNKISLWMSFASWVKHLSMTLKYFNNIGVLKEMKNKRNYYPEMDELKLYFTDDSGINTDEKSFAFILGILYGRVMQIQGAKGVNVNSNALTWLKRLTLSGKNLPELYVKIREKLLAYDAENVKTVRNLIKELGKLGNILGDTIKLDQTATCYFLLLGQSLYIELFPSQNKSKTKEDNKQDLLNL